MDFVEAAHGRAPAMATGIKRVYPDRIVFTYQGDGDLASIGMGEIVGAASRGELLTVIFINNANYGMTGGQMAPTTLPGQKTTSSPTGRDVTRQGYPIRTAELLSTLEGSAYVVRRSLHNAREIRKAKKAIRTAFEVQKHRLGFSMVELLSTCPTNWRLTPDESRNWLEERMIPAFPLGDYKISPAVAELQIYGGLICKKKSLLLDLAGKVCYLLANYCPTQRWMKVKRSHGYPLTGQKCAAGRLTAPW
jgi:2-oxoglutarate ferredoxin oxidoreductase subunit beta